MSAYTEALRRYREAAAAREAAHADPDAAELGRLRADATFAAADAYKSRWAVNPEYNPDRKRVLVP